MIHPFDNDPLEPGPDESLDLLCGSWRLFQLRKGHRFSTDDVACAWEALRVARGAQRYLDLGSGVGSVCLLTLNQLAPTARAVQVEAQEVSHRLARRTVRRNGLAGRVTQRLGDLRDPASVPEDEHGTYDLVTGSPPYIPLGKGVVSPHPQRAACRMELRGSVFDYCRTAARALAPQGWFVLVHSAVDERPEQAIHAAGLTLRSRRDVYFRRNRAPTIAVWTAGFGGTRQDLPSVVVREESGELSMEWEEVRWLMHTPGSPHVSGRMPVW